MRSELCASLRPFLESTDEGLVVDLFGGLVFPVDASVEEVAHQIMGCMEDGRCIAAITGDEDAVYMSVLCPEGRGYRLVFDADTRRLVTVLALHPRALERRAAAAN
jgi:hypothetical protein